MVRVLKTQTVQSIGYILDIAFFTHFSKRKKSRKPSILQSFRLEANSGNRTRDLRITSASLYRLSHVSLPVPLYHLF